MAYCVDTMPAVGDSTDVHATQLNPLGAVRLFSDGNTYIYLKGVADTIRGSWVSYDELFVTAGIDSDAAGSIKGPVAIAAAAVVANTFGWYVRDGHCICGAISGGDAAADGKVFATATVFLADDVAVTGNQIHGAIFRTQEGEANTPLGLSATAALATAEIHYPWIGGTDAII